MPSSNGSTELSPSGETVEVEIQQIVRNEWRIKVLEKLVERLSIRVGESLDPDFPEKARYEAAEEIREKYPNSGFEYIPESD